MVGSWYRIYATKNAAWIFMLSFLFFSCNGKRKGHVWANMKTNGMQFVDQKCLLNAYAWWCNDLCKMWGWNMITDKCRNNMFIMMPWRDAYAMHDMNAFPDRGPGKLSLLTCAFGGAVPHVCNLRRWYGSSGFPWQKTRPTYNPCVTTWCRHAKA